jgi:hypothetical protein
VLDDKNIDSKLFLNNNIRNLAAVNYRVPLYFCHFWLQGVTLGRIEQQVLFIVLPKGPA